jgi:hypothetical protein
MRDLAPLQQDLAGGRLENPCEEINQRGLAGAVRPDQRLPRAGLNRE